MNCHLYYFRLLLRLAFVLAFWMTLKAVPAASQEIGYLSALPEHQTKGHLSKYRLKSRLLSNTRDIWIYTPYDYPNHSTSYPLLVVFDGQAYVSDLIPTPSILDNLIANRSIPPLVAVFVSSIDQKTRNQELPCCPAFTNFLVKELLPWVRRHYSVTQDPLLTIVAGSSYGGLAATYAAWTHPNQFGNVLSQSGAFWWKPEDSKEKRWLIQQFEKSPQLPIKFYLDAGKKETTAFIDCPSILSVNRHFSNLLRKKGYQFYYHEFNGGHAYECWRETFAKGLIALIGVNQLEKESRPPMSQ